MTLVFDGHNDVLSRLWRAGGDPVTKFEDDAGHINASACKAGGFAGGFFAIYAPAQRQTTDKSLFQDGQLEEPLPDALEPGWALTATMAQAGVARRLADAGHIEIVTTGHALHSAFEGDRLACLLHLEGADGLDEDLLALDALYAAGLRSLGPVWSRPNRFAHGVPFAHKRTGDTGPGLTDDGYRLVRRCAELGILLDVSHITMAGFWDIAELGLPVVATHSNAWSLCRSSRNLTADQLRAIRESGGIVGLNFEPAFLSETGWQTGNATLQDAIAQLEALLDALGEDHVAFGSDFDGARLPQGIASAADLPLLVKAMEDAGYGTELITKVCHGNWLRFLAAHFERRPAADPSA